MVHQNFKLSACAVAILAAATTGVSAHASPSVTNVTIDSSQHVIIEGDNFSEGPDVALYDTFENASMDSDSTTLRPQIGDWYEFRGNGQLIQGSEGPGSVSIIVRSTDNEISQRATFGISDSSGVHGLRHFQEVYFSYTMRDLGDFPGPNGGAENFSDVSSTKDAWMMFGDRGDNTSYAVGTLGIPSGHDLYIPGWTGSGFTIAGNNTSMRPRFGQSALRDNWSFGGWTTKMFHGKLNPDDPYGEAEGFFSFINEKIYHENTRSGNLMTDQTEAGVPYPYWDRIAFYSWLRQGDANVERALDEVYVATGKNSNARVVITDSQDISDSNRMIHLGPVDWTDNKITAIAPKLESNKEYYVHVITSDNERSSGFPLSANNPNPPQSFTVE